MQGSEEGYQAIFEAGHFPRVLYDPATFAILAVNDAAVELYGYSRDEFLAITPKDLCLPEEVPKLVAAFAQPLPDRYHAGIWTHRKKDDTLIEVDVYTHDIVMVGRWLRLAELHDVTEWKRTEAILAKRTHQLEAVRAITAEIAQELDLARLLELITQRAVDLVGAGQGLIRLWDETEQILVPRAWTGPQKGRAVTWLRLGEGVAGTAAQRREGMIVNDFPSSPYALARITELSSHTAVLAEPLIYRDRLVGVIDIDRQADMGPFTGEDQEILRLFAAQAAIAIENARLYEAAVRRSTEREALLQASKAIESSLDLNQVLQAIVEQAAAISATPIVRLFLLDDDTQFLRCHVGVGFPLGAEPELAIPVGMSLSGQVAVTGEPLAVADTREDSRTYYPGHIAQYGLVSYLGLPVKFQTRLFGVLVFNTPAPRHYTADEITFLAAFAQQAAVAIQNARLFEAEQGRRRELEAVRTVTEEITRELDLETLLQLITQRATALVGRGRGALWLWDEAAECLIAHATTAEEAWHLQQRRRLGEGLVGMAAERREGMIVNDYRHWPFAVSETLERTGITAAIAEPLVYRDRLVGVINLDNMDTGEQFTDQDQELLRLFAAQAAIAIANARFFRDERERRAQLEAVRAVSAEITQELDLATVLRLVVRRACELTSAAAADIDLWDPERQILVPEVSYGHAAPRPRIARRLGEGAMGTVAQTRRGLILNDYRASRIAHPDTLAHTTITASLVEPLLYRDTLLGVIGVDHETPGRTFTSQDRDLLRLFADQAAIAIENARLHEAAVGRGAELEALLAATRSVMSGLDLQEILDRIVAQAQQISGAPHVKVLLVDRHAGVLRVGAARGTAHIPGETLSLDTGLSALVARSGEPVYTPQCAEDPQNPLAARDRDLGIQTYLGLPIKRGDEVLGVLTFNTTTPKVYSAGELAYLASFADQAAIAIEKARLFAELHDSYARLQAAQAELVRSEKLRGLGQMATGIAHDLNNMLAAILGQLELLKLRGLTPELQESLRTLETAASDGAQVVRRLQDFARQRSSSPLVPLELGPVVQEALDITGPRWKDEVQRRGRTIHVHVALGALPPILGHAPEIREVLTNLIFNAVDAMPQGGTLTFTGTATPEGVRLDVTDTGLGMPEAVRQRIFEPFFTTKGVSGTGLGLSVVYGIMERHGGRVEVASTPGQGTTFTLLFKEASAAPSGTAAESLPARKMSRCILLIDDDPMVRRTMTELLEAAGQTVLMAESGAAGLAQLEHTLPDLVLTDLGMPEMSGVEIAHRVKAAHPRLPVVLLTGWGDTAPLSAADRQAVDRVLGKPVRLADLLQVVSELTGSADAVGK